jgi:II/X family phage/plasmid replication protein
MKTVRKHDQVLERLNQEYPKRRASALFVSWMLFAGVGEDGARDQLSIRTFYRHRKELASAGVSWAATDVHIDPRLSVLPSDFRPFRTDPRHSPGEAPAVAEKLAPYRAA